MSVRTISYGGGVQSTAMLVLAARRLIDFEVALFANTGDDSEHPATLAFVRDVAMPWAERHGIEVIELQKRRKDGTPETLYGRMVRPGSASMPIPVRLSSGAPASRSCTAEFKARVLAKWRKEQGATPEDPAVVAIGISTDEVQRADAGKAEAWERIEYPLLDLAMSRAACQVLIADAGLPVPPKSACWFCPWKNRASWMDLKRESPELFDRSVALEKVLSDRSVARGAGPVHMTDHGLPLDVVIGDGVQGAFDFEEPDGCEQQVCWT